MPTIECKLEEPARIRLLIYSWVSPHIMTAIAVLIATREMTAENTATWPMSLGMLELFVIAALLVAAALWQIFGFVYMKMEDYFRSWFEVTHEDITKFTSHGVVDSARWCKFLHLYNDNTIMLFHNDKSMIFPNQDVVIKAIAAKQALDIHKATPQSCVKETFHAILSDKQRKVHTASRTKLRIFILFGIFCLTAFGLAAVVSPPLHGLGDMSRILLALGVVPIMLIVLVLIAVSLRALRHQTREAQDCFAIDGFSTER